MRIRKQALYYLLSSAIILFEPNPVEACIVCMSAFTDLWFPPLVGWSLFCPTWLLLTASITSGNSTKIRWVPSMGFSVLTLFVCIVFGAMYFGPFPLYLLCLPPLIISIRALKRPFPRHWEEGVALRLRSTGIVGLSLFSILLSIMIYTHLSRTDTDYVIKWQGNGPDFDLVQRLISSGPESLPELRRLVREGYPGICADAAEGLASYGDPAIDVPLLADALERIRSIDPFNDYNSYNAVKIETALYKLSGLNMPENSSVKEWREQWATRLPTPKPK